MQLLIAHHDAEVGAQLVGMVADYTSHRAELVASDAAARAWLEEHGSCDLLIAQLETEAIHGLELSRAFAEKCPRLETFFLPSYATSEERLEVARSKVFAEPINGERLLEAIARAESPSVTLVDPFHVIDIVQMCCLSRRSGAVHLVRLESAGVVYLQDGQLLHAQTGEAEGIDALVEMVSWREVQFACDPIAAFPKQTIALLWDEALTAAVLEHRQRKAAAAAPAEIAEPETVPSGGGGWSGQQFGTYRVGEKLCESFWDEVYEAEETSISRTAALHILRDELRDDESRTQQFLDEASTNARLDHPAIVAVYEAGEANGTFFYAREYVRGTTLEQLQAKGRNVTEPLALRIIGAVASALTYLAGNGIQHAPLRPSRIIVGADNRARLADIAVANPELAQTATERVEIQMLSRILLPLVKPTTAPGSGRVVALVHRMHSAEGIDSWPALLQEVQKVESEIGDVTPLPSSPAARNKTSLLGRFGRGS